MASAVGHSIYGKSTASLTVKCAEARAIIKEGKVFVREGDGKWSFVLRIPALGKMKQEDPGVPGSLRSKGKTLSSNRQTANIWILKSERIFTNCFVGWLVLKWGHINAHFGLKFPK